MNTYVFSLIILVSSTFSFSAEHNAVLFLRATLENEPEREQEALKAINFSTNYHHEHPANYRQLLIETAPANVRARINLLINPETRKNMTMEPMIFVGATGTGKTDLALVLMQEINMPFLFVKGAFLANEFENSMPFGLKLITKLALEKKANVFIDEVGCVARKHIGEKGAGCPEVLLDLLQVMKQNNLLFVGASYDFEKTADPRVLNNLKNCLYEIPLIRSPSQIKNIMAYHLSGNVVDSHQTFEKYSNKLIGCSNRTIKDIVCYAADMAYDRDASNPVIIADDFEETFEELKKTKELFRNKINWDREKIFNCTFQVAAAIAGIIGIVYASISLYKSYKSYSADRFDFKSQTRELELLKQSVKIGREKFQLPKNNN